MFINTNLIPNQSEEVIQTNIVDGKVVVVSQVSAELSQADLLKYKTIFQNQQNGILTQIASLKENYDKLSANIATIDELLANFDNEIPTP